MPDVGSVVGTARLVYAFRVDSVDFHSDDLVPQLDRSSIDETDSLPFGLVTMDRSGDVIGYNAYEAARAGFVPERVIGKNFFEVVAPCTNNYLIAQRFHDEASLDEELDYVFTLKMAPTPVRLRLLAAAGSDRQYLAVKFR